MSAAFAAASKATCSFRDRDVGTFRALENAGMGFFREAIALDYDLLATEASTTLTRSIAAAPDRYDWLSVLTGRKAGAPDYHRSRLFTLAEQANIIHGEQLLIPRADFLE